MERMLPPALGETKCRTEIYAECRIRTRDWLDCYGNEMPDFNFPPVYKNDGLQFDEQWQEKMFARYNLMRYRRNRRRTLCANKRALVQRDHERKMFSQGMGLSSPDLLELNEDNNKATNAFSASTFTQNTVLSCFDKYPQRGVKTCRSTAVICNKLDSYKSAQTPFVKSSHNTSSRSENRLSYKERSNQSKKYRFPKQPKPSEEMNFLKSKNKQHMFVTTDCAFPRESAHANIHGVQYPLVNSSKQFLLERPRSSSSIPGKASYMLISKKDSQYFRKSRTPTPSKIEEDLMRQRFPKQHHTLMCSLRSPQRNESRTYNDKIDDKLAYNTYPRSSRSTEASARLSNSAAAFSSTFSSEILSRKDEAISDLEHLCMPAIFLPIV